MNTIFEDSVPGRGAHIVEGDPEAVGKTIPESLRRSAPADLPQCSELDVVRHFTRLSRRNFSVDANFYPLGSCTMKYNPKFAEHVASLPGFLGLHPHLAELPGFGAWVQGALSCLFDTERYLCEITGMDAFTLQPMAGANGEFTGVSLMAAYHRSLGRRRTIMLIPDSAHGTNPASAALAGFDVLDVPSEGGLVDPEAVARILSERGEDVAGLMMTCPNTLGLMETHLPAIVEELRKADALLYYDGANMNAILGKMRVGDAGFDVVHLNLHKTFGTPHGGGGPGSGPVGVTARLAPLLPGPRVVKGNDGVYALEEIPGSIGPVAPFHGSFGVILKALAYIMRLGGEGLVRVAEYATLNANYLKKRLETVLDVPYGDLCAHEFVASAPEGLHALDIAKALLDRGIHAPTIYFPLIVKECLMAEPTETESKQTLDEYVDALADIVDRAGKDPAFLPAAPTTLPVSRPDETTAARHLRLTLDMA
ncbi:MAG: aminomethyl-transferring glycine dehydrogenase subunit GcvPB [Desulfovibrio sp.]|jgi:glycine dehydrogenase subunit 2|nr:aminomethyl-transferring glycine dehydrogenase subunit GcvPB [Desulfovibrio sp.]